MRKQKKNFNIYNKLNISYLKENKIIFFKYILLSNLKKKIKIVAFQQLHFNFLFKYCSICVVSGRKKSVNKFFFLSRIALRDLIYSGSLSGFVKSSW